MARKTPLTGRNLEQNWAQGGQSSAVTRNILETYFIVKTKVKFSELLVTILIGSDMNWKLLISKNTQKCTISFLQTCVYAEQLIKSTVPVNGHTFDILQ